MRLVTWNVNGLRACERKGFFDWLARSRPDVLCLQEVRATAAQLSPACREPEGYAAHWHVASRKGYSGVATWSRVAPREVRLGGLGEPFDHEGRLVETRFERFTLLNVYVPNGRHDQARVPFKLAFFEALIARVRSRLAASEPLIVTGDFNVAREPLDLANARANVRNTGFLPAEREMLERLIACGLRDVFRERHPGEKGHYSMWSNRPGVREKNVGWRMDYFLLSPDLVPCVTASYHEPAVMGSDHCPVGLALAL